MMNEKETASCSEMENLCSVAEKPTKKPKKLFAVIASIVILCVAFLIVWITVIIPENNYKTTYDAATELYSAGKYDEAIAAFEVLNKQKDCKDMLEKCYIGKYGEEKYPYILKIKNAKIGDYIEFGNYEQDDISANGHEPIEWIVLEKEDRAILVISRFILFPARYHDNYYDKDTAWGNCSLHYQLDYFSNSAFNKTERKMILRRTVAASENPLYSVPAGKDKDCKLFLLSVEEALKYFPSNQARICLDTPFTHRHFVTHDCPCNVWWLRTRGGGDPLTFSYSNEVCVLEDGSIDFKGHTFTSQRGIRPAMWLGFED
ncbi:MAG: hypothetical protein IJR89_03540 [Clostridia bacterium]|nr:hypothetical protein [Clostridia bacterium]